LLGGALPGYLVVLAEDGPQPQGFQMMFEQHLRRIWSGHLGVIVHHATSMFEGVGDVGGAASNVM
jgi:hypothetical protein